MLNGFMHNSTEVSEEHTNKVLKQHFTVLL